MLFETPTGRPFEIPDDWWLFADMDRWTRGAGRFYPPSPGVEFEVVTMRDIEPPSRAEGVPLFRKYKLVPVLFAFQSPECALPPLVLVGPNSGASFGYCVQNGFHRYYASVAVGYPQAPAVVVDPGDHRDLEEALGLC